MAPFDTSFSVTELVCKLDPEKTTANLDLSSSIYASDSKNDMQSHFSVMIEVIRP